MSYVSRQLIIADSSSNANFRAWGSTISAAISGMGWLQTADPQINWSTVTAPGSGSYAGSEWWIPQDGKKSFVVRIEYGASTGSPLGVNLRITIAGSTDGSGNINDWSCGPQTPATSDVGHGANTYDCYFSGDVNRMCMLLWRGVNGSAGVPFMFCIERTKNVNGTDNEEGVSLAMACASNQFVGLMNLTFNGGNTPATIGTRGQITFLFDAATTSQLFNGIIPVFPAFPVYAGKYGNALSTVAFVHSQDVPEGGLITVTQYGVLRTYFCSSIFGSVFPSPTNYRYCMRYD